MADRTDRFAGDFGSAADQDYGLLQGREISRLQDDLLVKHIRYVSEHSPFYRRLFQEEGVGPGAIVSARDLELLPLTTKEDLESHNLDFLCVPESLAVDLCLTSGTTGRAVALLQSARDLERLGYNEERAFRMAGIGPRDRALVAVALDRCFMAGLAYFLGLSRIGATVMRGGAGSLAVLGELVSTYCPTVIVGVPSLLLKLAEATAAEGIDPASAGAEKIVCIGEPIRTPDLSLSPLGSRLAEAWGAKLFGTYASTEMATAFCDCEAGVGGHLLPELVIVETVDEEGRAVPHGTPGEVIATPLGVEAMPLVRYRTGDVAELHRKPCACGRSSWRLGPVVGRKSQMLKYRGTTLYPSAIYQSLQEIESVDSYYLEVHGDYKLSDRIRVIIGTTDCDLSSDWVAERISARTRVRPEVVIEPSEKVRQHTRQEGQRKPVTFFDYRKRDGERR